MMDEHTAKLGRAPVCLTIQSEVPPYRYAGDQYVRGETAAGRGEAAVRVITITPKRTVSHDFAPEAGWFGRVYFRLWRLLNPVPA